MVLSVLFTKSDQITRNLLSQLTARCPFRSPMATVAAKHYPLLCCPVPVGHYPASLIQIGRLAPLARLT